MGGKNNIMSFGEEIGGGEERCGTSIGVATGSKTGEITL